MAELSIVERVQAGAEWLDEHAPGWAQRIDLFLLSLTNTCDCILGQVFGDYHKVVSPGVGSPDVPLIASGREAARLGMFVDGWILKGSDVGYREYYALEAEWRRLIESRRTAVILSA